ncbi:MAG: hypothetical protein LBK58_11480, partial [Prevotellaceae bacterium]|nr:hypothetical protein [Prevotellaceae bacterium]
DRRDKRAKLERVVNLKPEHINPEYDFNISWKNSFKANIKNTVEDELADVIIRTLDLCGHLGIDIERHIEMKMKYNESRGYKHGKNY